MSRLSPLAAFGFCSALLGTVYFVYFFHVIGRPDLVMSFLSNDINAFYIFFALLLAGFLATGLQLMPSVLVGFAFGVARWNGIEAKKAARFSFLLLACGVVLVPLIGVVGFWFENTAFYTRAILFAFFIAILLWSLIFFYKNRNAYNGHESFFVRMLFSSCAMVGVGLGSILFFTAIMLNILRYGAAGDEWFDYFFVLLIGASILLASTFPGMVWISLVEEDVKKKVKFSVSIAFSVLFTILMMAPDLPKVVVFNAGKIVGLHSNDARYYALNGGEEEIARHRLIWPKGAVDEDGMMAGKQLFSLGGNQLICPSHIALTVEEMLDRESGLGADCKMFSSAQLEKGELILKSSDG